MLTFAPKFYADKGRTKTVRNGLRKCPKSYPIKLKQSVKRCFIAASCSVSEI